MPSRSRGEAAMKVIQYGLLVYITCHVPLSNRDSTRIKAVYVVRAGGHDPWNCLASTASHHR